MKPEYQNDDWFPTDVLETFWQGVGCPAPNGYGIQGDYPTECDSTSCELHDVCPAGSYCGLASHFEGVSASHWNMPSTSNANKWRTMLVQDMSDEDDPCYFTPGEYNHNKYNTDASCFSILGEWERMRHPTTGMFHLKLCYQGASFGCIGEIGSGSTNRPQTNFILHPNSFHDSLRFASLRFASFRFVSLRFASLRFANRRVDADLQSHHDYLH